MANSDDTANSVATSGTGRVKQTRRRQRLSCVECTRRRQKCDRQIPCSLCVSRGIPHLCRWEPILARPPPQRPPDGAPMVAQQQSTIAALTARIAALEETVLKQNLQLAWGGTIDIVTPRTGSASSTESHESPLPESTGASDPQEISDDARPSTIVGPDPPTPDSDSSDDHSRSLGSRTKPAFSRVDVEVQLAAAKMAQLTLAPPNEYVGGGTILCAIHKLGGADTFRYPYARSGPMTLNITLCPDNNPLTTPISFIVSSLPPRETVHIMIEAYFQERNWKFGIPERWFKSACQQMWDHLDTQCPGCICRAAGGCSRCVLELNPHWLALLFAVLALAPHKPTGLNPKTFFIKALEARRLVEDIMLASPRYSFAPSQYVVHGVSLSCIGAALMASWLSDHGRISDAWKLAGSAIRQAQAVGLHRDPTWHRWEKMDAQECELRVLAWWYLIISDRIYSLILGRPTMASQDTFDVKLVPGAMHGDGSPNPHMHFQQSFIALMQLVESLVMSKCLGMALKSYASVLEMDKKFKLWYSKLHPALDWRRSHTMPNNPLAYERSVAYQRHMSAAFYLGGLMNLHRPYLQQAPPVLPPPWSVSGAGSSTGSFVLNPSRERCIETAMELVRVLCDAREEAAQLGIEPQVPFVLFHYAYFVFDGAVALVDALSQDPPHPKAEECLDLIYRAMEMLAAVKEAHRDATDGEADTASRAVTILAALRKAGKWDERFWKKDGRAPPPTCDVGTTNAPSASSGTATEQPSSGSYGLGAFALGNTPFDSTQSQFCNAAFPPHTSASASASIPFITTERHASSISSFSGPTNVQTAPVMPRQYGDPRDLGVGMSLMAPPMDFSTSRGGAAQSMMMPFDMLQNSENDIDWGTVMGSVSDTNVGGNWFIG